MVNTDQNTIGEEAVFIDDLMLEKSFYGSVHDALKMCSVQSSRLQSGDFRGLV